MTASGATSTRAASGATADHDDHDDHDHKDTGHAKGKGHAHNENKWDNTARVAAARAAKGKGAPPAGARKVRPEQLPAVAPPAGSGSMAPPAG